MQKKSFGSGQGRGGGGKKIKIYVKSETTNQSLNIWIKKCNLH